jgi:hypothetical protein
MTAKPSPSGLIPEVFIDRLPRPASVASTPPTSSAAEETVDDDTGSDVPRQRPRRLASNKVIILSDDDDVEPQKINGAYKKAPAIHNGSSSGRPFPSSDSEDYHAETTSEDETDDELAASSEGGGNNVDKDVNKHVAARVTTKKPETINSDDAMDVDVDEPRSNSGSKKVSRKRKSDGEEERPAKKQKRREDTDPWKLESNSVKKDWTQMHAPPLEMFHFARKVVDEYTYLDGKILSMVLNITADRLWVLSGTPPIHDFGALKTIAAFLDIHLGIDDDAEGHSALVKKRRREQTGKQFLRISSMVSDVVLQPWRSFIHSGRSIAWNGMLIAIKIPVKHSWTATFDR